MAKKGRNDLTAVVSSNIFDNTSKEIDPSEVRAVLEDFNDSKFNIEDDQLRYAMYNETQTLEQYLAQVVGAIPIYGVVKNFDIGSSPASWQVEGIISSAEFITESDRETLIEINFSEDISERRLIPVLTYSHSNWGRANDSTVPVIRRISSTRINLTMRETEGTDQDLDIEIIAI